MSPNRGGLPPDQVSVVSPRAYCVSDEAGDADGAHGLFFKDTRHLSRLVLLADGGRLEPWGSRVRGSTAEFEAGFGGVRARRRRILGGGLREEVVIFNGSAAPVEVELLFAADFADLFEVRGYWGEARERAVSREESDGAVRFVYTNAGAGFSRATTVFVEPFDSVDLGETGAVRYALRLTSGEERRVRIEARIEEDGQGVPWQQNKRPLYGDAPALGTDRAALLECYGRSVEDLASLAFEVGEGLAVPAAGAPWYMALFGRDALLTAYATVHLSQEPARNVLQALARHQAAAFDDYRDAEPGKILHELREGELARLGEVPHSPYYGTVDATPLFLILLHEHRRWTADDALALELEGAARRALDWLLDHADTMDGYVAYEKRSSRGLVNQGWKDSDGCILFRDGREAAGPIALCEAQGYAYDAYLRTAELAGEVWGDEPLAGRLRREARDLRERFDRDFWVEDRGHYALALDGEGRRVDSLTSNVGHLLWSGIVPEGRAKGLAGHLLGDRLFSGFGVRTMATGEGGYDAEGYHTGTVWPHENALISLGLARYGFREEANRIALALLDAAPSFDGRLPELYAGYDRAQRPEPVPYPTACSPQAWAAATVPLLVRVLLGLEPDSRERRLRTDPVLPEGVGKLRLRGVPAFGERHEVGA